MYFLASAAGSAAFVAAGWRSKQVTYFVPAHGRYGGLDDEIYDQPDSQAADTCADVRAVLRLALKRLTPMMARQCVQADLAAPAGLMVHMRPAALADLLEELLAIVLQNAPASRILLTAAVYGERIYVGVADDMLGATPMCAKPGFAN